MHEGRFINDFFGKVQSLLVLIEMLLDCCFNCFDVDVDDRLVLAALGSI